MASRSTLRPQSAPPQPTKSRVSYEVDPYDNVIEPPQKTNTKPKRKCGTSTAMLAAQAAEAEKKAKLRAIGNHNFVKGYQKHLERVQSARPKVDSSCPIVPKAVYVNSAAFNRKLVNFARIQRENAVMLRRIAAILEGNGSIDNRLRSTTKPTNNRARARQHSLLQITFDNLALLKRIEEGKSIYSRKEMLKDYDRMEKVMAEMSLYPLFWKILRPKGWEAFESQACRNAERNPRPQVYFECGTESGISIGRIVIELRADIVPMTAENFRCLCTGEMGLSYKCSKFTRVVPGIQWQGGDITEQNGLGSASIYGETFPDENFELKHDEEGVVSMANYGKNTNGCQFLIDARPLTLLDGRNVVVGKVIGGLHVLHKMTKMLDPNGAAKKTVYIIECGQYGNDNYGDTEAEADEVEETGEEGEGATHETTEETANAEAEG